MREQGAENGDIRRKPNESELSIFSVITLVLNYRLTLVLLPLCVAAGLAAYSFFTAEFVAESRFLPNESNGTGASISGIAAQFGVNLGNTGGESGEFYAQLVRSRDVLTDVATTEYTFIVDEASSETMQGTYFELNNIEGDTPTEEMREAISHLRDRIQTRVDLESGLVTIRVRAKWRRLAESINSRIIDLVNEFNLEKRRSNAEAERDFVEGRYEEAQNDLRRAEQNLERFLSENRQYQNSPRLTFEYGRLQRRVDERQQVYLSLSVALEQARIEEIRNTPLITVMEGPAGSAIAATSITMMLVIGVFGGSVLAVLFILGRELVKGEIVQQPEAYARFQQSRMETLAEARRIIAALLPNRLKRRKTRTSNM